MKRFTIGLIATCAIAVMAIGAMAQQDERGGRGEGRGERGGPPDGPPRFQPPPNPLLVALDEDKDGELSADEIANAAKALKTLDKNEDGKLTREELRPDFRPRGPRPDGPRPDGPRPDGPRPDGPRPDGPRGPGGGDFIEGLFGRFDENKDGKISKDEAPDRMKENFDRIDANDDGSVDKEELKKAFERLRGGPRGEGGPRGDGPRGEGDGERPPRPRRPDAE